MLQGSGALAGTAIAGPWQPPTAHRIGPNGGVVVRQIPCEFGLNTGRIGVRRLATSWPLLRSGNRPVPERRSGRGPDDAALRVHRGRPPECDGSVGSAWLDMARRCVALVQGQQISSG